MGIAIERRAGWIYFGWSAVVLLTWGYLTFGPGVWHRDLFVSAEQDVPLQWFEYVQMFLGALVVAAIYGSVTLVFLLVRKRTGRMSITFISFAVFIGLMSWLLGIFSNALEHIDCADDCAPYIPDQAATATLDALLLPFALIPPVAFLLVVIAARILQRRQGATDVPAPLRAQELRAAQRGRPTR